MTNSAQKINQKRIPYPQVAHRLHDICAGLSVVKIFAASPQTQAACLRREASRLNALAAEIEAAL